MEQWSVHWLDATGDLSDWKEEITREIRNAYGAMAPFVMPGQMDLLVERGLETVRPETGMTAHVTRPTLTTVILDPYNDNFEDSLRSGLFARQIVNAAHRGMRMAGPGYGFTLGGAMVSEGLAAQFVRLVFGNDPEIWDSAVSEDDVARFWPEQRELMSPKYDAALWFSGRGDKPRWLGYGVGCKLVERWMTSGVDLTPERLINVPAPKVLSVGSSHAMVG